MDEEGIRLSWSIAELYCPNCKEYALIPIRKKFRKGKKIIHRAYVVCAACRTSLVIKIKVVITDKPVWFEFECDC